MGGDTLEHRAVRLVCHGLDTIATVIINGRNVGQATNQFVRYVFDIKDALQVREYSKLSMLHNCLTYREYLSIETITLVDRSYLSR